MVTKVYIIRHAEALGNIDETFQGRIDKPVTEKGHKQLEALSERFKDIHIDVIYSSPLIRTRETADAVNKYHGLEIIYDEGLIEIDGGVWEGVKWAEIPEKYPLEYRLWTKEMHNYRIQDGECMTDVYERIRKTIDRIVSENAGKTIAIVSHGCAIRNYLCYAGGFGIEGLQDMGWADNTAVSYVEYNGNVPELIYKYDASHLPEELMTLRTSKWCRDENGKPCEMKE